VKESTAEARLSYPLHALLLIGVSWCFYAIVALALALFMLPIVPLAPVFVMILVALGGLLSSVHEYARSVATPTRATRAPIGLKPTHKRAIPSLQRTASSLRSSN